MRPATSTPVTLHIVPLHGPASRLALTFNSGDVNLATWSRSVSLPDGLFTLQVDVGVVGTP